MAVTQRGRKWAVTIKDKTHPKGQRYVGAYETEEVARAHETVALRERDERYGLAASVTPIKPLSHWTVAEYGDRFLSVHCEHLSGETFRDYRYEVERFKREHGARPMHSFTRQEAVDWSMTVPKNTRRVVRRMFDRCEYDGGLTVNHFKGIEVPSQKPAGRGGTALVVLDDGELADLIATAERIHPGPFGVMLGAFIEIAAHTGMRPGELFALRKDRVHPESFKVDVLESRARSGALKSPKNGRTRTIAFPPPAVAALRRIETHPGSPLVFTTKRGKMLTPHTWGDAWRVIVAASGTRIKDVYELRHYCATRLVEAGLADYQVGFQLGHTDNGRLVRLVYFHPRVETMHEAVLRTYGMAA